MAFLVPAGFWAAEAVTTGALAGGIETVLAGETTALLGSGANAARAFGSAIRGLGARGIVGTEAGYGTTSIVGRAARIGTPRVVPASLLRQTVARSPGYIAAGALRAGRFIRRAAPYGIAGGIVTAAADRIRSSMVQDSNRPMIQDWTENTTPARNPTRPSDNGISPPSRKRPRIEDSSNNLRSV